VLHWMMGEPDVQFVADCDIQKSRRERVKKMVDEAYGNTDCKLYPDAGEFLASRPDIDAMLVTTGDRMHATMSVMALRAGKDVYSEKPSSMTVAEGRAVVEAARRYGRVYQTGVQRLSEANFTFANELLRTGRLGRLHTVRAHIAGGTCGSHDWLPAEPELSKDECNWDAWLGPCPWRPYNSRYVSGGWRGYYDFHTGAIGEWGAHTIAQCQVAMGLGETSGLQYAYVNNESGDGMRIRYANGVTMILQQKGWHGTCGVKYEGDEGWVAVADGYSTLDTSSPALLSDFTRLTKGYTQRTGRALNHVRNFFDCIKSRARTVANEDMMHRSMSTVHAANICMWLGRDMTYDPVREEFVNDPAANRLRSRAARAGWAL
ncbi:MAG: hypothetical protein BWK77_06690, partial [Verrucomicrobia bacterium A1]